MNFNAQVYLDHLFPTISYLVISAQIRPKIQMVVHHHRYDSRTLSRSTFEMYQSGKNRTVQFR